MQRISGILLPLSSVPGSSLCGNLGAGARRFADFLQRAGQHIWQMLPVNPIDECFSPYASVSTFAGDPKYIDLDDLVKEGLLDEGQVVLLKNADFGPKTRSAFHVADDIYKPLLRQAFGKFKQTSGTKYHQAFTAFMDGYPWVGPHAIFCALAAHFGTLKSRTYGETNHPITDWSQWTDIALKNADEAALRQFNDEFADEIAYYAFEQLLFDVQWNELHQYCKERDIQLVGDVPIYVAKHSVDTWANRELFQIDGTGKMIRVAGVPPDAFNPDGQCWDLPLYDWDKHKETGYDWWLQRLGTAFQRFDAVRLDHFIGFYHYCYFPQPDWVDKSKAWLWDWKPGPAESFFETVLKHYPDAKVIAEDLGVMKLEVHQLRDKFNFPGINVFQFWWDNRRNSDATAEWKENSVVCTGTHDTNTLSAWFDEVLADRKKTEPFWDFPFLFHLIKEYIPPNIELNRQTVIWGIVRKVMSSPGRIAVFPMQDLLGLPSSCRMNFPGHAKDNWVWRLENEALTDELADRLNSWTKEFGR